MIDPNKHVYCSRCAHFEVIDAIDKEGAYSPMPKCEHSDECDIWDCEDSKPFKDRPFYKENT